MNGLMDNSAGYVPGEPLNSLSNGKRLKSFRQKCFRKRGKFAELTLETLPQ